MDISEDDHFYLYDLDYRGGERGLIFTENDVYPIFKFERPILRNFFDFHRDGLSSRSLAPEGVPYKYSPSSTSECIMFPESMDWYVYNERYYADLVKIFTKDDNKYQHVRTLIGVDARDYKEVARIFEAVRGMKAEEASK